MQFGEKVKTIRERKGLTQQELADLAGMPVATIRNQEQGRRTQLLFDSVVRLAAALGVPVDEFAKTDEFRPPRKPR